MKDLHDVLRALDALEAHPQPALLVTVVRTTGSTYRRPGARLLMYLDGTAVGMVSSGCVEGDIRERGRLLLEAGAPQRLTYNFTGTGDLMWGSGLGCNGTMEVLVEPLLPDRPAPAVDVLRACGRAGTPRVLATVFHVEDHVEGAPGVRVGDRLGFDADGAPLGTCGSEALRAQVTRDAASARQAGTTVRTYTLPEGRRIDVLLELIRPPQPLVVFGAGHDAVPVVRLARMLGWEVTVVDHRRAYLTAERFPEAARRVPYWNASDVAGLVPLAPAMATLVMTHHYLHDRALLEVLLPSPVRYIGVLGPGHRTEQLLRDLADAGVVVTPAQRARLYAPVGLHLGAETAEEIALAVLAEIQAVLAGRPAGFLRDHAGPIH